MIVSMKSVSVLLAVASIVTTTRACSDVKLFMTPCTVSLSAESITRAEAQEAVSEVISQEGLEQLEYGNTGYLSFDVDVLDEATTTCEIPLAQACNLVTCGCSDATKNERRLHQCLPYFFCTYSAVSAIAPPGGCRPQGQPEEIVVAVCQATKCIGFLVKDRQLLAARNELCGEEVTEFCTVPTCPSCAASECCNNGDKRRCFCKECDTPALRRKVDDFGTIRLSGIGTSRDNFSECKCSRDE